MIISLDKIMSIIEIIIVIFDVKEIAETRLKIVKILNIVDIIAEIIISKIMNIFFEDFIEKITIIINIAIAKAMTNLLNTYLI